MNTSEYENIVLAELRKALLGPTQQTGEYHGEAREQRVVVEEVRLETSSTGPKMISVLYRDRRRPECLFGWQREAVEPVSTAGFIDGPEIWATIAWANFWEYVEGSPYGLPTDCVQDGITWTN